MTIPRRGLGEGEKPPQKRWLQSRKGLKIETKKQKQ